MPLPFVTAHGVSLEQSFLLEALTAEQRQRVLALAKERRLQHGQVIFSRGDPGGTLMAVAEGRVRISLGSEDGKEVVLAILEPGEVFGEIALLDGKGRTADATAMGDCRLLVLRQQDFLPFVEQEPGLAIRLMQVLCERIRQANGICESIAFLDLPSRLARLLLQLDRTHGEQVAGGRRIRLDLSQSEIGNLIATSRESVNKQLKLWEREGLIAFDHGHIVLKDPTVFEALAPPVA